MIRRLRLLGHHELLYANDAHPRPLAFLAICAEFFGGMGLLVGLLGRVAAFGIATNMLVAIFTVHIHYGFFANWFGQQNGEGFEYPCWRLRWRWW